MQQIWVRIFFLCYAPKNIFPDTHGHCCVLTVTCGQWAEEQMIYMTASLPKETLFPTPLQVTWCDVKWLEIASFKPIFPLQITHLGALPQLISRWDVVVPLHMLCYRGLGTSQTLNASCWPYPQNGCRHPPAGHCRPQPWPTASARACGGAGESFGKPGKCPLWESTYSVLWGKILRGFLLVAGAWVSAMKPCEEKCRWVPVAPPHSLAPQHHLWHRGVRNSKMVPSSKVWAEKNKKIKINK